MFTAFVCMFVFQLSGPDFIPLVVSHPWQMKEVLFFCGYAYGHVFSEYT